MPLLKPQVQDEDSFFGLEGDRLDAAETVDRNVLLLAGPGAGKTHLLVAHSVYLASAQKGHVIQLTFSRNAAAELGKRTKKHLSEYSQRRVYSGTIHSYALSLLQSYGWRLNLGRPLNVLESNKDIREFAQEVAAQRLERVPDDFAEVLDQKLRRRQLSELERNGDGLMAAVIAQMVATGNLTWSLIVDLTLRLLKEDNPILSSVRHHNPFVLVDEAQDCDPLQLDFLETLVGRGKDGNHIFIAMDPDQSLYAFRDADPARVLAWAEGFEPRKFELTENYRCKPRIVALSRYVLGKQVTAVEGGEAFLMFGRDKGGEARYVADQIAARIEKGRSADRMAVLGRNNYVIRPVIEVLQQRGMAHRVREAASFDAGEEKILAALILLHEWDEGLPWAERSQRLLQSVFDVSDPAALAPASEEGLTHPGDVFADPRWVQLRDALGQSTLGDLITETARILEIKIDPDSSSLLELAKRSRRLAQLLQQARTGGKVESAGHQGTLVTTFHGAKGLEFDVVFLVGCEDGVIPDYRANNESELKQERRALYVALSRAAEEIVVTGARRDGNRKREPCRFLPGTGSAIWTGAKVAPE